LLLLLAAGALAGEPVRLTILHTNDLHGQLDPLPASPVRAVLRGKPVGGFAHLASMVRSARKEAAARGAHLLLLDAGDLYQGTPVGNETRGEAVVAAMNALAYDAVTLGNHEFDYGLQNIARLAELAEWPLLAANVGGDANWTGSLRPYVIFAPPQVPCRVAVIGLITPDTPNQTTPDLSGLAVFSDPVAVTRSLQGQVDADLYIILSHLGRRADLALARALPQIDLIVGGHSHTPMNSLAGTVRVVQTHSRGQSLGRVDLDLDPGSWEVVRSEARLLAVDPTATLADAKVQEVVERYGRTLRLLMQRVVGRLAAPARRARGLRSSPVGNWMSDVIRETGKAEVGFMNKGGIRCDLEAGEVTAGDVYRLMPFDNTVVSMDLSGAELVAILKNHLEQGGYPALEWSGLEVLVEGRKLAGVSVAGEPLNPDRVYRTATQSFLARGGDGFRTFRRGRRLTRSGVLLRDALANDLGRRSPVTPPSEARIRALAAAR
jgi:2',3'-cyclic-nucleotide 2'-phosphodiesterase (5'-nucleotidase family)